MQFSECCININMDMHTVHGVSHQFNVFNHKFEYSAWHSIALVGQ